MQYAIHFTWKREMPPSMGRSGQSTFASSNDAEAGELAQNIWDVELKGSYRRFSSLKQGRRALPWRPK